jgi:phosphatidate cytidylyltransferase
MTGEPSTTAQKWADLRPRLLSAIVMVAVGAVEIWLGGLAFAALVVVLTAVMLWELAGMTQDPLSRNSAWALGVAAMAGLTLAAALTLPHSSLARILPAGSVYLFLALPALVLCARAPRDRWLAGAYALLIMLAGYGLVTLRDAAGISAILWLMAVVVASDVLGYFAGRMLGGPKFWPQVSPKKTWSGTIAGWIGAALVGLGFVVFAGADWLLLPLSALVALAGQMGDILESWIKRRAGVKDASHLIPGHGGVLDRFDALIGAVVLVLLIGLVVPVTPLIGG